MQISAGEAQVIRSLLKIQWSMVNGQWSMICRVFFVDCLVPSKTLIFQIDWIFGFAL